MDHIYSEEWWKDLMKTGSEPAGLFNKETLVYSEMAVRQIVVAAVEPFRCKLKYRKKTKARV